MSGISPGVGLKPEPRAEIEIEVLLDSEEQGGRGEFRWSEGRNESCLKRIGLDWYSLVWTSIAWYGLV